MGRRTERGGDDTAGAPAIGAVPPATGSTLAEDLAALEALVDRLTSVDVVGLDGPAAQELVIALAAATDRLTALRVRALPCVEADGRWALDGTRTFAQWVALRVGGSVSQARRDVRLGRALREELRTAAEAVTAGTVSVEHARVLATVAATSDTRREVLAGDSACNEAFLVAQATLLGVDQFRRLVRTWAAAADPDADDRGYSEASDREFVELSRTLGGFHLAGFLTDEHGQALATALAAVAGVPAAGDERTTAQRRAQALADLARLTLDHGLAGTGAAVRPHLSVHVTLDRLDDSAGSARPRSGGTPDGTVSGPAVGGSPDVRDHRGVHGSPDAHGKRAVHRHRDVHEDRDVHGSGDMHRGHDLHRDRDVSRNGDMPRDRLVDGPTVTGVDGDAAPGTRGDESELPFDACRTRPPRPAGLSAPPWPGGPPPGPGDAPTGGAPTPATFDDGTPVPPALLARLACDSEVTRIVFGPPGVVLDVGRARRTVTGQLRRAVIARDRHCAYPGCTAPPALGEVHHVRHWIDGGVTSTENSILLCWHHHDLVHRADVTITRTGAAWYFTDRHGRVITAASRRLSADRTAPLHERTAA